MTNQPTQPSPRSEKTPPMAATVSSTPASAEARFFLTSDLEAAIEQMHDVRGARIVASETEIDEIHVMASRDVKPKKLVRDIVTLLLVRYSVRLDYRRISIVQSDTASDHRLVRPVIYAIRQTQADGMQVATLELRCGGYRTFGVSKLPADASELRGGCLALIDSVEQLLGQQGRLELREVNALRLHGHELIVVMIAWRGELAEELFVGATIVADDRVASAARAALDAINRKLVRVPIILGNED